MTDASPTAAASKKPQLTQGLSFRASPSNSMKKGGGGGGPSPNGSPGRRETGLSLKFMPSQIDMNGEGDSSQVHNPTLGFSQRIE